MRLRPQRISRSLVPMRELPVGFAALAGAGRPRVPRFNVEAEQFTNKLRDKLTSVIENAATRVESFSNNAEKLRWKRRLNRTADRYCRAIAALPGLIRADITAFQAATYDLVQDERFNELAIVRELSVSRRKRVSGRGPRGRWLSLDGQWLRNFPSHHRIAKMAEAMDVRRPLQPISRRVRPKPNGHRVTFAFSLPDQARKRMVADMVAAVCRPNPYDFGRDGKGGHHGAATAIRRSISRNGYRYFAVADLRDAYPSITARHIADLIPLDPIVIRNVVTVDAGLTIVSSAFPPPTGRRLPQGAVSSAPILSALLGRSLRPLAGVRRLIVNQGDDIAIGAPTHVEADMALRELTERLTSLRAGPLRFGKAEVQSPFDRGKLSFCGYSHRWFFDTQRLHCAPADKSVEKMKIRLRGKLQQTPYRSRRTVQREYMRAWEGAFPCWTRNKYSKSSIQVTADQVRTQLRIDELP